MTDVRYKVREPNVVSEIIDGEAIIMDLLSGDYFSTAGLGAAIWDGLLRGATRSDLMAAIDAAGWGAAAQAGVAAFLDDLAAQQLIDASPVTAGEAGIAIEGLSGAYVAPTLERHDDMQDLIQLDPIHDVDEIGWPVRKTDA